MEGAYYSRKISKTECFPQLPWPLLCYHCGSDTDVEIDSEKQLNHEFVGPQCTCCRNDGVKIVCLGKERVNQAAPDTSQAQANVTAAARQHGEQQEVPVLKATYIPHRIVGKAKLGKMTKVFWEDSDGQLCPTDACTWQEPSSFKATANKVDARAMEMIGCTITIEEQRVQYTAEITSCLGNSLVKLKYTSRVDGKRCQKKERNMDMNLPPMEVASWWREDGYETLNEEEKDGEGSEDEDGDEEEDSSEDEEDEEMEEGNDSN